MDNSLTKAISAFCFCGLTQEEFRSVKKDAYVANYQAWKIIHVLLAVFFGGICFISLLFRVQIENVLLLLYFGLFIYSLILSSLYFFFIPKGSVVGQIFCYLTIVVLLAASIFASAIKKEMAAVTFQIFLIIMPMLIVDRPYVITIITIAASIAFLFVSSLCKTQYPNALKDDIINTLIYCPSGIIANIYFTALRAKDFILQKKLTSSRDTDGLTGLTNRVALSKFVNEKFSEKADGVMLMMDLDHFKDINDTYGHAAGDAVLEKLASILIEQFGEKGKVGRFGGDEFCVFLPDLNSTEEAKKLADNLISEVNRNLRAPARTERIGICVGIARIDPRDADFDDLFRRADLALYNAKKNGRNRAVIYGMQISSAPDSET